MRTGLFALVVAMAVSAVLSTQSSAQQRSQSPYAVEGLAVYQGEADLDDGSNFSANRAFARFSTTRRSQSGVGYGVALSLGQFYYDFNDGPAPWEDIRDIRVSVPVRFRVGGTASVFISPQVRWDYETDASASDGYTYGAFGGVAWRLSDSLTIGPALGVFTRLEDSGVDAFPALLVDWDINDRLNLGTGGGLGATEGPGLNLTYKFSDVTNIGLTARSESIRFRLNDDGIAPGGIGEDKSVPVVATFEYNPNPNIAFSIFAGAEFNGELTLENMNGRRVDRQSYDTVPIAGFAAQLRF